DNCRVLCLRCFYIKRGSFAKLTLMEFLTMLYTVKEGEWMSVDDFFQEKAPADVKKRVKTLAAKKNWLVKEAQPADDRGVDGVIIMPDNKKRKVRVGAKMESSSIKRSEFENHAERDEKQKKDAQSFAIQSNDKDVVDKAMSEEPEEAVDPIEEMPSEAESDASSGSGFFGVKHAKPVKEKQPDARTAPSRGPVKPEAEEKKHEKLLAKAKSTLSTLEALSPMAIWQGTVKEKDIGSRLEKAGQVITSLEKDGRDDAKSLIADLQTSMMAAETHVQLLCTDMAYDSLDELDKILPHVVDKVAKMPSDCLNAIMSDIGKKVIQDCDLAQGSVADTFFFDFISSDDADVNAKDKGLSLRALLCRRDSCSMSLVDLLKLQCSLGNAWMDKIKSLQPQDVDKFLRSIPGKLWNPELARKCAEHPTSDALHEDYKVLSPRVVIDLHKFLSCAKVLDEKEPFGIELVRSLKTIAALASATSPRVNLMFRSNPSLWQQALTASQNSISEENALAECDTMVSDLTVLGELLQQFAKDKNTPALEQAETQIQKCQRALDLVSICKTSTHELAPGKVESLTRAVTLLQETVNGTLRASDKFRSFVESLWAAADDLTVPDATVAFSSGDQEVEMNVRCFLGFLTVEGDNSFLQETAQALYDYILACPNAESLALRACCDFASKLEKLAARITAKEVAQDGWAHAFLTAVKRFNTNLEALASKWIAAVLQEKGADAAWGYVNGCLPNLPKYLKSHQSILMQASFLEGLTQPKATDDLSELSKQLKAYVTIKTSIQHKALSQLFPERLEKVVEFEDHTSKNIITFLQRFRKSETNKAKVHIDQHRPVLAAIEMWQLDEHKWMFQEENKDAQALIELLMDFMERTLPHCTFLRNSMALKTPSLKSDPVMLELSQTQSDLEAGVAKNQIAFIGCTQTVVEYESAPPEEQLKA
ncbi:Uncharacterized protein SCF082_LOCUS52143, partial [Durusdinium trenchii]